jgi:hypothetical protein
VRAALVGKLGIFGHRRSQRWERRDVQGSHGPPLTAHHLLDRSPPRHFYNAPTILVSILSKVHTRARLPRTKLASPKIQYSVMIEYSRRVDVKVGRWSYSFRPKILLYWV